MLGAAFHFSSPLTLFVIFPSAKSEVEFQTRDYIYQDLSLSQKNEEMQMMQMNR